MLVLIESFQCCSEARIRSALSNGCQGIHRGAAYAPWPYYIPFQLRRAQLGLGYLGVRSYICVLNSTRQCSLHRRSIGLVDGPWSSRIDQGDTSTPHRPPRPDCRLSLNNIIPCSTPAQRMGYSTRSTGCLEGHVSDYLSEWLEKALGDEPETALAFEANFAKLSAWTCTCAPCSQARGFLTAGREKIFKLESISAANRKHVEKNLRSHARTLANFETISRRQGLQVIIVLSTSQ